MPPRHQITHTTPTNFQRGDRIGNRYEARDIEAGAMGIVYCAITMTEGFQWRLTYHSNKRLRDRFPQEARIWTKLERHPNVVSAFSVEVSDQPFITRICGGYGPQDTPAICSMK